MLRLENYEEARASSCLLLVTGLYLIHMIAKQNEDLLSHATHSANTTSLGRIDCAADKRGHVWSQPVTAAGYDYCVTYV